jgi:hypothetical protein
LGRFTATQPHDMTSAEKLTVTIATLALAVSTGHAIVSAYFGFRDRGRIKTESKIYPTSPRLHVSIANAGRRPVVLRMLIGTSDAGGSGHWIGTYLGEEKKGYRLAENERYDTTLEKEDYWCLLPGEEFPFKNLFVEDSLGNRYEIKDARANLEKLHRGQG